MTDAESIANKLIKCFKNGNKLMICGAGGHASQAAHMAAEFTGKFEHYRQALPAIALTTDASAMTGIGNDWSFDYVFARQIEALGKKGDILITVSTSPQWTPIIRFASAIVTDIGGSLSHAAIISREFGIPAVVGTQEATKLIKDGQKVTVNGTAGVVEIL